MRKLGNLDSRLIYLIYLLAIAIPLFKPMGLPMSITPEVRAYIDTIDSLPPGSTIWIGADYDPGSAPENSPQLAATFRHAMSKDIRVIILSMWAQAPDMVQALITPIAQEMDKEYGVDYVNLGYKPGGGIIVRAFTREIIENAGGVDYAGMRLETMPLMQEVTALDEKNIGAVVSINVGAPGYGIYMDYVTDPLGIPLLSGPVAGTMTQQLPFLRSGQISGMLPGLTGAAQYEIDRQQPGQAAAQMDAQSLGHIIILVFVVLGNLGQLAARKEGAS